MKMLQNSQATFFDVMELPLTSSRVASHAKTLALQERRQEWVKELAADCGPRLSDLLASYDRATSSWRTSQTCLVALAANEADGLAEFSETWPSAGMMRNGKTYQRQPWALPIVAKGSGLWPTVGVRGFTNEGDLIGLASKVHDWEEMNGMAYRAASKKKKKIYEEHRKLWPTPTTRDYKGGRKPEALKASGRGASNSLNDALTCQGHHGNLNPPWVEWLMGFPIGWTELQHVETQ